MKTFSEFLNENETIKVNVDFNTTNDKKKFVTNLKNNGIELAKTIMEQIYEIGKILGGLIKYYAKDIKK